MTWVLALLVGCDFTSTDQFVTEAPDTAGPALEPPGSPTAETGEGLEGFECVDLWAAEQTLQIVSGDTTGADDRRRPSCRGPSGGEDGPEVFVGFVVPTTGTWEFDLVDPPGNDFDTVMAVLDGCGGAELGCDDDFEGSGGRRSRVTLELTAGQTVVVQVDGYSEADFGPFSLSIESL
ncbi:MAG: hypothetical protein AAF211_19900 [Myxococcota bacterium]